MTALDKPMPYVTKGSHSWTYAEPTSDTDPALHGPRAFECVVTTYHRETMILVLATSGLVLPTALDGRPEEAFHSFEPHCGGGGDCSGHPQPCARRDHTVVDFS